MEERGSIVSLLLSEKRRKDTDSVYQDRKGMRKEFITS